MRYAILFAAALVGCAHVTPQQVAATDDMTLCQHAVASQNANTRNLVMNELNRRGQNCQRYMPLIQAQMAQQAATDQQLAAGAAYFSQMGQPVYRPSRNISCESRQVGGTVLTDCR